MRKRLRTIDRKYLKLAGIVLLILILPISLLLVRQIQDYRSSAALPDQLETEYGVLSSGGVTKQSDSGASGGQYVKFAKNTNPTSGPTPTNPPGNTPVTDADVGPRAADWSVINNLPSNRVFYMPSAAKTDFNAFKNFIASVPDGKINAPNYIVFDPSKGTGPKQVYTVPDTFQINRRFNLVFWGYNARLYNDGTVYKTDGSSHRLKGFEIRYHSEYIDIMGFEIQTQLPPAIAATNDVRNRNKGFPGEYGHGIAIYQAGQVRAYDNWIHHVNGEGIYITGEHHDYWNNAPATKIDGSPWRAMGPFEFAYNKIQKTGRQGITINQGDGIRVHHNLIEDTALSMIATEDGKDPDRWFNDVHVTDNIFRRWNWHYLGCYSGGFFFGNAMYQSRSEGEINTPTGYEIARNWFDGGFMGYGNEVAVMCTSGSSVTEPYSDGRTSNNDLRNHLIAMGSSVPKKNYVIKDNLVTIPTNQKHGYLSTSNWNTGGPKEWGVFKNVDGLTVSGNTWSPMIWDDQGGNTNVNISDNK